METLLQDIRFALRTLSRNPGYASIAVIALTLGIGANTGMFTIVNAVLLRPLPYPGSERLVMLWETNPRFQASLDRLPVTPGDFMDWREQNTVFEHVSAFGGGHLTLTGAEQPERISGASVSPNFFSLMGVEPVLGRSFRADEEKPGDNVVVISYALWQRRFAADAHVVGKTLTLDGSIYTVVGVAPEGFQFPRANEMPSFVGTGTQTELWKPMTLTDEFVNKKRANHQLCVIARLKPRITQHEAQTEMAGLAERLAQNYPESNEGVGVQVVALNDQIAGSARLPLQSLMAAVILVLLIACANVANLLLARSSARQKEIAIRLALGATRGRVIRQLLTESVMLSMVAAVAGTLLSFRGVKLLAELGPENFPRLSEVSVDAGVLFFTIGIALVTGVLFGLVPAVQASKANLSEALKEGQRGLTGGAYSNRIRGALVISEVALSLMLLIGAGLMIKSLERLLDVDPGFNPDNTLTAQIALSRSKYPVAERQAAFFEQVTRRIEALPGVKSVGLISSAPLSGGVYAGGFSIEGRATAFESEELVSDRRMISPQYFNALGIPLINGRYFTDRDDRTSPGVVIVSESFARRFLPNEDPVGKRIKLGGRDSTRPWLSIVGIAGDVRDIALEQDARPCVYIPYPQFPTSGMTLVVRAAVDPRPLAASIRNEVWAIDKDQPLTEVKTMNQYISDSSSPRRFNALLFGVFAGLALTLASVGIYGVMAYSVTQRVQEIGIRVALGAQRADVIRLIVGRGMLLVLAGVIIGLAGALALTRVMSSLLYEVSATDPLTFGAVSLLILLVALLANYLPACRATKVDPMIALRCE